MYSVLLVISMLLLLFFFLRTFSSCVCPYFTVLQIHACVVFSIWPICLMFDFDSFASVLSIQQTWLGAFGFYWVQFSRLLAIVPINK